MGIPCPPRDNYKQYLKGGAKRGAGVEHKYSKPTPKPIKGAGMKEEKIQANAEATAKAEKLQQTLGS